MKEARTCEWIHEETTWSNYWETQCGDAFEFTDGNPKNSLWKFCPYCGKEIIVQIKGEE